MTSVQDVQYATQDIIGQGANRVCVKDPLHANQCLKIDLPKHARSAKNLRQKIRRVLSDQFVFLNENYIEWHAHQRLLKRLDARVLAHYIAPCLNLEQRGQTWVLSCELVRSDNGDIAQSIYQYIQQQKSLNQTQLFAALDCFEAWLIQHNIPLFDLNAGNLVVQHCADTLHIKCIDIKSTLRSKEIIPLSYWSKAMMHRKIKRRMARLKGLIQQRLQF